MFGFWCLFSFHPPNLWVFLLGISIDVDVLFPELHFSIDYPTKVTLATTPPTTTKPTPSPTIPTTTTPILPADGAEQLGRTLRFVEISVAGRHGQRVRGMAGKKKSAEVYLAAMVDLPCLKLEDEFSFLDGLFSCDTVSFREGKF